MLDISSLLPLILYGLLIYWIFTMAMDTIAKLPENLFQKRNKMKLVARDFTQLQYKQQRALARNINRHYMIKRIVCAGDEEIPRGRAVKIEGYVADTDCFHYFIKNRYPWRPALWTLVHPSLIQNMIQKTIVLNARGFTAFGQWVIPISWRTEEERLKFLNHYHSYLENMTKHNQKTLLTELTQNNVIGIASGELIPEEMTIRELIGEPRKVTNYDDTETQE